MFNQAFLLQFEDSVGAIRAFQQVDKRSQQGQHKKGDKSTASKELPDAHVPHKFPTLRRDLKIGSEQDEHLCGGGVF